MSNQRTRLSLEPRAVPPRFRGRHPEVITCRGDENFVDTLCTSLVDARIVVIVVGRGAATAAAVGTLLGRCAGSTAHGIP